MNTWSKRHSDYAKTDWIHKPSLFAEWVLQYLPTSRGRLLDLGAGQGQDSRFFANEGFEVVSTDFSEKALKFQKNLSQNISNMQSELLDLNNSFPYDDESFDVVYAHLSLQFFTKDKTQDIFEEIYRILTKDGILALLVNSDSDPEYGKGKKIEDGYYELPYGLRKRFYNINTLHEYVKKLNFETIVLDNKGETYKDKEIGTTNLVRYVGKKK